LVRLVATIPCHNDARFLVEAVDALKKEIDEFEQDYLIVISEDGSTDSSAEISRELASRDSKIKYIHADSKLGRGQALMNTWKKVDGEIYSYIDCDMATDIEFYRQLVQYISKGYDLATGSRYVKGSVCMRPFLRRITSKAYNAIIRTLFADDVYDHQCGFKAFSRRMVEYILGECRSTDWFWDAEAIVLAHRNGYKIKEFPVVWVEKKGWRTPLRRLINDIYIHGRGILSFIMCAGRFNY